MTAFEQIRYEAAEQIATITLTRPERLNAFTLQMGDELIAAVDRADADDDVRVVIVTGEGRGFCAGADLAGGGDTFRPTGEVPRDKGGEVTLRFFDCRKPLIAAINGPAVGVGITMTLAMDMRLAADDARMGFVFTRRGIVPESASSWFLPQIVGISQALEWALTGRVFDAQEALAAGLVRSLHAKDDLLGAARALAREIADNTAPVGVALTRRLLWRSAGDDHPIRAHRAESRLFLDRAGSRDAAEGIAAFLEKRPPRFPERVSDGLVDPFPDDPDPVYA